MKIYKDVFSGKIIPFFIMHSVILFNEFVSGQKAAVNDIIFKMPAHQFSRAFRISITSYWITFKYFHSEFSISNALQVTSCSRTPTKWVWSRTAFTRSSERWEGIQWKWTSRRWINTDDCLGKHYVLIVKWVHNLILMMIHIGVNHEIDRSKLFQDGSDRKFSLCQLYESNLLQNLITRYFPNFFRLLCFGTELQN